MAPQPLCDDDDEHEFKLACRATTDLINNGYNEIYRFASQLLRSVDHHLCDREINSKGETYSPWKSPTRNVQRIMSLCAILRGHAGDSKARLDEKRHSNHQQDFGSVIQWLAEISFLIHKKWRKGADVRGRKEPTRAAICAQKSGEVLSHTAVHHKQKHLKTQGATTDRAEGLRKSCAHIGLHRKGQECPSSNMLCETVIFTDKKTRNNSQQTEEVLNVENRKSEVTKPVSKKLLAVDLKGSVVSQNKTEQSAVGSTLQLLDSILCASTGLAKAAECEYPWWQATDNAASRQVLLKYPVDIVRPIQLWRESIEEVIRQEWPQDKEKRQSLLAGALARIVWDYGKKLIELDLLPEKKRQALLVSVLAHLALDYEEEEIEPGTVTTLFKKLLRGKKCDGQLIRALAHIVRDYKAEVKEPESDTTLFKFYSWLETALQKLDTTAAIPSVRSKLIALMLRSISLNCQPEIVQLHLFESGQRSQLINRDRKRQAKGRRKSVLRDLPLEHEVRAPKAAVCSTDANNWQTLTDPDIVLDLPKTNPDSMPKTPEVAEQLEEEKVSQLLSLAFVAQQANCIVGVLEHCVSLLASLEYIKVYAEVHGNVNEAVVDSLSTAAAAAAADWKDSVVNEKDKQQASIISQHDLDWIFNPQSHGVTSAFGGCQELACYPVARYPENQNALVSLSLQRKLDEMSPREYLTAVLHDLSLEERDSLMVDEKQRRKTFLVNWPHDNHLSGEKMAQAGFYCVDDYDRVQCVFCRGSLHRWEAEENPMVEHARSFPFCRFIKGMDCGNREYKNDVFPVDDLKNITLLCHPDMKKNRDGTVSTNSSALGMSTNKAQMMKYAPYETRKATFSKWPSINKISPEKLVEAGFYYTGFDDNVRCFYCAGSLREWEKTDDPWVEHARWFPECSYLIQLKGELYIEEIHATTPEGKKCSRQTELEKKTAKEYKQRVSVQQAMKEFCLKMGHDKDIIDEVMRLNDGVPYDRPRDMIEMVYKVEDSLLPAPDRMDSGYVSNPVDSKAQLHQMVMANGDLKNPLAGLDEVDKGAKVADVMSNVKVPAATCPICFRNTGEEIPAIYIGLPCGHLVYCETCKTREKMKCDDSVSYKPKCVSSGCNATLAGMMRCYVN